MIQSPYGRYAACLLALILARPAQALSTTVPAGATARHKSELQQEQSSLKAKLQKMKEALAAAESAHAEAADALAASETAISRVNRQLQQLAQSRHQVEAHIAELQARQQEVLHARDNVATQRDEGLRDRYALQLAPGSNSPLQPDAQLRADADAVYLEQLVQARHHRIAELEDRRTQLATLEAESRQQAAELVRLDQAERGSRAQLVKQQLVHKSALNKLAEQIKQHKKSVAGLERDDARLGNLINKIEQVLADENRKARANSPTKRQGGGTSLRPSAPELPAIERSGPLNATQFAKNKGKLHLPVTGRVVSRFGAARLSEEGTPVAGAPPWKGVFIAAEAGTPVHAVAAGQVVFADWLRGFGNLIIMDHGEGFLSVYAFNETLLRTVGDKVESEGVIAAAGSSGGNAQSGLYFEMRYQGQAFDPLGWAVAR